MQSKAVLRYVTALVLLFLLVSKLSPFPRPTDSSLLFHLSPPRSRLSGTRRPRFPTLLPSATSLSSIAGTKDSLSLTRAHTAFDAASCARDRYKAHQASSVYVRRSDVAEERAMSPISPPLNAQSARSEMGVVTMRNLAEDAETHRQQDRDTEESTPAFYCHQSWRKSRIHRRIPADLPFKRSNAIHTQIGQIRRFH